MQDLKIGDRFRFTQVGYSRLLFGDICEIISIDERTYVLNIRSKETLVCGMDEANWEYLGNFAKDSNYNNLYKLLNNE